MATTAQKNSFVTVAEQISLLNLNATEIITRLMISLLHKIHQSMSLN